MYVRACGAWRDFKILLEGYYYCERKKERKKLLAKNLQTVLYVAPGRLFRKFLDQIFRTVFSIKIFECEKRRRELSTVIV